MIKINNLMYNYFNIGTGRGNGSEYAQNGESQEGDDEAVRWK